MSVNLIPLQYYQYIYLNRAFENEIPVKYIYNRMAGLLPIGGDNMSVDWLKHAIIQGGSAVYMKLIEICDTQKLKPYDDNLSILSCCLQSHCISQLYRYLWVWSEHNILSKILSSNVFYTNYDDCKACGVKSRPPIEEADGLFAGRAILLIEAVCPCNIYNAQYTALNGGGACEHKYIICSKCRCCKDM